MEAASTPLHMGNESAKESFLMEEVDSKDTIARGKIMGQEGDSSKQDSSARNSVQHVKVYLETSPNHVKQSSSSAYSCSVTCATPHRPAPHRTAPTRAPRRAAPAQPALHRRPSASTEAPSFFVLSDPPLFQAQVQQNCINKLFLACVDILPQELLKEVHSICQDECVSKVTEASRDVMYKGFDGFMVVKGTHDSAAIASATVSSSAAPSFYSPCIDLRGGRTPSPPLSLCVSIQVICLHMEAFHA
ncbi:hypothetical protein RIF29_40454 [Crotalaria pallida]|uniref:Uncharacterized protein n=1 Tax=Crotalaria pallida TaxID=3830 RepID=A0AAN9E5K6_CROPI